MSDFAKDINVPTNDCISRQAAIDVVHHTIYEFFDVVEDDDESPMTYKDTKLLELNKSISTRIKDLPFAEPEPYMVTLIEPMDIDRLKGIITKPSDITLIPLPKVEPEGRWEIIHPGETGYSAGDFRCSVCGQPNRCYHLTRYCCNCGARMVNRGKVKKEKK